MSTTNLRFILLACISVFLAQCSSVHPVTLMPATQTPTANVQVEPTPTPTPVQRLFFTVPPLQLDVSNFVEQQRFGNGRVNAMDISPDGEVATVASSVGIWLYRLQVMKVLNYLDGAAGQVLDVAWSPDGLLLAAANQNGSIHLWDAETGTIKQTFDNSDKAVLAVDWSPDGRKIVAGGRDNLVTIWDVTKGNKFKQVEGENGGECSSCQAVTSLAWSPDGNLIAVVTNRILKIWNWQGEQFDMLYPSWAIMDIEWSPDGRSAFRDCQHGRHDDFRCHQPAKKSGNSIRRT